MIHKVPIVLASAAHPVHVLLGIWLLPELPHTSHAKSSSLFLRKWQDVDARLSAFKYSQNLLLKLKAFRIVAALKFL
jgi:hypothetical protein